MRREGAGHYRISRPTLYAVIRRQGREWRAEIRRQSDGELERYAGIWGRLQDAEQEAVRILDKE